MSFCIRCGPSPCPGAGIISMNVTSSSSARALDPDSCTPGSDATTEYIPGPSVGNLTIQAYAFGSGDSDKWGGTKCKGTAQASQSNIQRYDSRTNTWYIIPSKIHKAQITGGLIEALSSDKGPVSGSIISMKKVFYKGETYESQITNGISITTQMTTVLGAEFSYSGPPIAVDIPDVKGSYSIASAGIVGARISSISLSVEYPSNPITVSYTFEFPLIGEPCTSTC